MFQSNALTGVILILGIFWGAIEAGEPRVALGALAGLATSTLTGFLLGLPARDEEAGLWGFNGVLVGAAFMTFLGSTLLGWLALIFTSAMSVWVRAGLDRVGASHKVSSFTMPFVLCTWLFLAASRLLGGLDEVALSHPMLPAAHIPATIAAAPSSFWEGIVWPLKGVAQIMLIDSWVTGLLFLIGLACSSVRVAIWAFVGSLIGTYGAWLYGAAGSAIESGLYGFSPSLTAIALSCTFYKPSWRSALWAILGAIATLFVQAAVNLFLGPLGLPALTAPFCITTWLFLLPLLKFDKKKVEEEDHSAWFHHPAEKGTEARGRVKA